MNNAKSRELSYRFLVTMNPKRTEIPPSVKKGNWVRN